MDFPLTLADVFLACGIVAIGSIVQGNIGFGLGPLAVPLLVLIDPVFVPGPLLLAALVLTVLMYRREQHAVKEREIGWAVLGRLAGTVLGAALLRVIPQEHLSLLFGVMVLLALAILAGGFHLPVNRGNLFGAGTLSGFMGTASSIGGAPMALLYHKAEGPRLRGTLSGIFVIGTVFSIVSLMVIGRFGFRELFSALILFPGIVVGFFVSGRTLKIFDGRYIRIAVFFVSACSAVLLIVRSLHP